MNKEGLIELIVRDTKGNALDSEFPAPSDWLEEEYQEYVSDQLAKKPMRWLRQFYKENSYK